MDSRRPPHIFGPLAQLVEQETLNLLVVGSIPTRPTKFLVKTSSYMWSELDRKVDVIERMAKAKGL